MKIVSTGRTISTTEFLDKKQKEKRKRRTIYALIAFVLLTGVVLVSRYEKLRIKEISISGANVIPEDKIRAVVEDQISDSYLWLVPKNNALLYPKRAVKEMLFRKFPRFSSVALFTLLST